ncbi:RHS repeat domain-containing protein [Echinicola strongylocentroti]|uniref:RHS repeat domain-containing protein n=1 Tax=Echinicola strongylocentroti TaxID=1795355 RepID=UPI0021CEBF08|nr:RHS repeat-associated core domain-containing protein [Echinicola strongylocentroti]
MFQSKTLDVKTGWYDFHARQYDPALGRWFAVDPQNQFISPYLVMGNNPIVGIDPDGEFVVPALIGAAISFLTNGIANVSSGEGFFKNAGLAAITGAVGGAASFGIGQVASSLSGIGKVGFQAGAHSLLGGSMNAAMGGILALVHYRGL